MKIAVQTEAFDLQSEVAALYRDNPKVGAVTSFLGLPLDKASIFGNSLEPTIELSTTNSFTGDGKTDAAEYSWFVWGAGGAGWQRRNVGEVRMLRPAGATKQSDLFGSVSP